MNLKYSLYDSPNKHPQQVMRELGITYLYASPQTIGDCWWFWGCDNVPEQMPNNIKLLELHPSSDVSLTKEEIEFITEK